MLYYQISDQPCKESLLWALCLFVFNCQMSFEAQFINLENLQDMGGEKGMLKLLDHQGAITLDFTCGSILQYNLVSIRK